MPEHDPGWFYLVRVGDTATAYDNFDNAVIWDAAPYGAAIGWTPRCVWSLEVATEAIRQADAVMDVRGWG